MLGRSHMLEKNPTEISLPDPFTLNEMQYRTPPLATLSVSHLYPVTKDSYYLNHHGAALSNSYSDHHYYETPSRGGVYTALPSHNYGAGVPSHNYEMNSGQPLSSTFAGTALGDYNRRLQNDRSELDVTSLSVSSRYSFAGPSLSYR